MTLSRRAFLRTSLAGAGLTLAAVATPMGWRVFAADDPAAKTFSPAAWFTLHPDGQVDVVVNKSEMGQGVYTGLPMILADELGADLAKVVVVPAPVARRYLDPVWRTIATGGSTSVRHMTAPLRAAGAAGRAVLRRAGARRLGVPLAQVVAEGGEVIHPRSGRRVPFGELAAAAARLPVPRHPPLKKPGAQRLVGTPQPRLDVPAKTRGTAIFGLDVRTEGMLFAAVARPPAYGARLLGIDAAAAKKVPGVEQVVRDGDLVGVCAEDTFAAFEGREALGARWSEGTRPDFDDEAVDAALGDALTRDGILAASRGRKAAPLRGAKKTVEAIYALPYLAHATMEPMNCTADVRADRCEVWAPTQSPSGVMKAARRITGLPESKITVHTTYLGGGFGRRSMSDFAEEALRLSKAAGRPMQVVYAREDDTRHDYYRPATRTQVQMGLDGGGRLRAWVHRIAAPSLSESLSGRPPPGGIDRAAVEGVVDTPYAVPTFRVEYLRVPLPPPLGYWRSVGHSHNAFTVESALDEVAHAAGVDPLALRLSLLRDDRRARRVLRRAAEAAGWGRPLPEGRARGLARHRSFGTEVAQVAEVSVDTASGRVRVHRVVCAVDCGPVVNPDTVKAQMLGAITMGWSAARAEAVRFAKGGVVSANFDDYALLPASEAPEVEVHLVPGEALGGVGEPGLPPLAPAVANAVFAATGARVRTLPMTPAVVKAALEAAKAREG